MTDVLDLNRSTPEELLLAGKQLALKADIWDPKSVGEIVAKILDMFGLDIPNWEDALANWDALKDAFEGTYTGDDLALRMIQHTIGTIRRLATGLINPSRLPLIPFSHIGEAYPNLLENGGFDGPDSLDGQDIWIWDGEEGKDSPGSARTHGNGTRKVLLSNTVAATAEQKFQVSGWVKWNGVSGGANALRLSAVAYNGTAVVEEKPIATISTPASTAGWTELTGTYEVPTGADSVRVQVEVGATVTLGTVWWDAMRVSKYGSLPQRFIGGLVDALGDLGAGIVSVVNQIGAFFDRITGRVGATIADIQEWVGQLKTILSGGTVGAGLFPTLSEALRSGVNNLQAFVQNIIDTILSALRRVPVIGGLLPDVDRDMRTLATTADRGLSVAQDGRTLAQSTVYNIATNRPLWSGLDSTAEVSFPWAELGYASSQVLSTQTLTNTISRITKIRCQVDQIMNTVTILASRSASQQLNLNISRYDEEQAKWVRIYASPAPGFGALIGSSLNRVTMKVSEEGLFVNAGELYAFELIASGGNITVASKNFPVAPIPSVVPGAIGGSRNPTTVTNFSEITSAQMEAMNDTNTVYLEFGSDIGQLAIPRHYFVNFDNGSWQNWVRNTVNDLQLKIENGRVKFNGTGFSGGLQIAIFGSQSLTDNCAVEAEIYQLRNSAYSTLVLSQDNMANYSLADNAVMRIQADQVDIMTGGTIRATGPTGNGLYVDGRYRLRYDEELNTFFAERWNGLEWSYIVHWVDSSNIVAHGPGRRYPAIGINRTIGFNGGEIDNFQFYDIEPVVDEPAE
ncbi:minor tail protein [Gordonia phage Commandaria]|uniref:Minor tail protein n=1 Tax=Gordonia phage Commandaria TaxID=3038364 RepID=A0AAF0K140_9CAUD|nr:minor tail protein [Gordonia phage Commandaria]WGH20828.1 minor tail protein [Gordonia phage Commandaria]